MLEVWGTLVVGFFVDFVDFIILFHHPCPSKSYKNYQINNIPSKRSSSFLIFFNFLKYLFLTCNCTLFKTMSKTCWSNPWAFCLSFLIENPLSIITGANANFALSASTENGKLRFWWYEYRLCGRSHFWRWAREPVRWPTQLPRCACISAANCTNQGRGGGR